MIVRPAFWRTPLATRWLPLGASVGLHALVVGMALVSLRGRGGVPDERPVAVPDAVLIEGARVGGVPNPGLAERAGVPPVQSSLTQIPPDVTGAAAVPGPARGPAKSLVNALTPEQNNPAIAAGVKRIGVGPGSSSAGTDVARYGAAPTAGGAQGPKAQFMGISGDAVRIVYVCDASASMMGKLPRLRNQLQASVDLLKPVQWFNVIFFKQARAYPMGGPALVQATAENRRKVAQAIAGLEVGSDSDPRPALDAAFALKPQVVYLLTDGGFEEGNVETPHLNRVVADHVKALNPNGSVRVNTILFVSRREDLDEDNTRAGLEVLRRIAEEQKGTFKVVVAEELGG